MNKKQVRTLIVALLVVIVALYFIASTYARYTTSLTGKAQATVAKWNAVVTDGTNTLSENFTLTFTVDENQYVRDNRIAPATSATAKVEIDLTGTEVATDIDAIVDSTSLQSLFGDSADAVSVSKTVATKTGANFTVDDGLVSLPNQNSALGGSVVVTITLTWDNDENNNVSDTTLGKAGSTLQIPVTVKAQQHIAG